MYHSEQMFENTGTRDIVVIVEPWASEYSVAPGSTLRIVLESQIAGQTERDVEGDRHTIWGWKGSTYEAYLDTKKID
jgi:hypothetical protein